MRSRLVTAGDERRTMMLVFETGDEVVETLTAFAVEHKLHGSHLEAIGALQSVTLGYWDWDARDYQRIELDEQVEVVSLTGNIANVLDGEPTLHAHLVVARRDGSAHGGHLLRGVVRPTLEMVLTELPVTLRRRADDETGLALLVP